MSKKIFDYLLTFLTVAASVLLIAMLFVDLIHYDLRGSGSIDLTAWAAEYYWPNGYNAINADVAWIAKALIFVAAFMSLAVIQALRKKNAALFFWGNVIACLCTVAVSHWGIGESLSRLEGILWTIDEYEIQPGFYLSHAALGFSTLAALMYTFYNKKLKKPEGQEGILDV